MAVGIKRPCCSVPPQTSDTQWFILQCVFFRIIIVMFVISPRILTKCVSSCGEQRSRCWQYWWVEGQLMLWAACWDYPFISFLCFVFLGFFSSKLLVLSFTLNLWIWQCPLSFMFRGLSPRPGDFPKSPSTSLVQSQQPHTHSLSGPPSTASESQHFCGRYKEVCVCVCFWVFECLSDENYSNNMYLGSM